MKKPNVNPEIVAIVVITLLLAINIVILFGATKELLSTQNNNEERALRTVEICNHNLEALLLLENQRINNLSL